MSSDTDYDDDDFSLMLQDEENWKMLGNEEGKEENNEERISLNSNQPFKIMSRLGTRGRSFSPNLKHVNPSLTSQETNLQSNEENIIKQKPGTSQQNIYQTPSQKFTSLPHLPNSKRILTPNSKFLSFFLSFFLFDFWLKKNLISN